MFVKIDKYNYSCNSEDMKRTKDISQGAVCVESDTGDIYLFDAEDGDWNKMCSIKE